VSLESAQCTDDDDDDDDDDDNIQIVAPAIDNHLFVDIEFTSHKPSRGS